jgi:micrococcal nuclease
MATLLGRSLFPHVLSRARFHRRPARSRLPPLPAILLASGIVGAALSMGSWPESTDLAVREVSATYAPAHFSMCSRPPHRNCVIDGDTFYLGRQSIRIADIDAPEVSPPRCIREADLGARATDRLYELLNAGPFELRGSRTDRYGRQLRTVYRDGRSLGDVLVSEGLARKWTGRREPWC